MSSSVVKVSPNDVKGSYLLNKLVSDGTVTFTVINPGGDEQLQLVATGGGGGGVITTDVASLQALASGNAMVPGALYFVLSGMPGVSTFGWFYAADFGTLNPVGVSSYQNTAMSGPLVVEMYWDLVTNTIRMVQTANNNIYYNNVNNYIDAFPFDNASVFNNVVYDPAIYVFNVTSFINNVVNWNAQIGIDNASVVTDYTIGQSAAFFVGGTSQCLIQGGAIGDNSALIAADAVNFNGCLIQNGKGIDTTSLPSGYTQFGATYNDFGSTFTCDVAYDLFTFSGDLFVSNWSDGGDYSFCGIFTGLTTSADEAIGNFNSTLFDHNYTFNYVNTASQSITVSTIATIEVNQDATIILAADGDKLSITYSALASIWQTNGDCFVTAATSGGITNVTVAQLQALVGVFKPLQYFEIGDAYGGASSALLIQAYDTTTLFPTGYGPFQNGAMFGPVNFTQGYQLASDFINLLENTDTSQTCLNIYITNQNNAGIDNIDFSNGNFNNLNLLDPDTSSLDTTSSGMYNVIAGLGARFKTFPGCTIGDIVVGTQAIIDLRDQGSGPSTLSGGTYGNNCFLRLWDSHSLTNCTLGPGLTIDLATIPAGYSATGKSYTADGSNFVADFTEDLDGLTLFNIASMSDGGDYSFCGNFNVTGDFNIDTILSNLLDHSILILCTNGTQTTWISGGNIRTSGGQPITAQINASDDYVGFNYNNSVSAWYQNGNTLIQ